MRVKAKSTVKTPYVRVFHLQHTVFLTVIFTFALTRGAALTPSTRTDRHGTNEEEGDLMRNVFVILLGAKVVIDLSCQGHQLMKRGHVREVGCAGRKGRSAKHKGQENKVFGPPCVEPVTLLANPIHKRKGHTGL